MERDVWLLYVYYIIETGQCTAKNKYRQKRNCTAIVPVSTFMYLWAIYILPPSICLFCCRKYVDRSWKYINRSQTHECGGTEAAQFPEKEYINGIFVAVWSLYLSVYPYCCTLRWGENRTGTATAACRRPNQLVTPHLKLLNWIRRFFLYINQTDRAESHDRRLLGLLPQRLRGGSPPLDRRRRSPAIFWTRSIHPLDRHRRSPAGVCDLLDWIIPLWSASGDHPRESVIFWTRSNPLLDRLRRSPGTGSLWSSELDQFLCDQTPEGLP